MSSRDKAIDSAVDKVMYQWRDATPIEATDLTTMSVLVQDVLDAAHEAGAISWPEEVEERPLSYELPADVLSGERDELTPAEAEDYVAAQIRKHLGMTVEEFRERAEADTLPRYPWVPHLALLLGVPLRTCGVGHHDDKGT